MFKLTCVRSLVAATTLLTGLLAAAPAHADEKGTLQIWINGDKAFNGLAEIGKKFTKDTNIKVVVEHPQDAPAKFQQAASAHGGPSIMIWAHDRAGEWISAGLIEPVNPKPKFKAAFDQVGWDAFTFDSKTWGYPLAIESIGLIYNKTLVPKPPASFDDVLALDKKLAKDGTTRDPLGLQQYLLSASRCSRPMVAIRSAAPRLAATSRPMSASTTPARSKAPRCWPS